MFKASFESTEEAFVIKFEGDFAVPDAVAFEATALTAFDEFSQLVLLHSGRAWESVDGGTTWTAMDRTPFEEVLDLTPLPADGWYASYSGSTSWDMAGEPDEFKDQPATRFHIDEDLIDDSLLASILVAFEGGGSADLEQAGDFDLTAWVSDADNELLGFDMTFTADSSLMGGTDEGDVDVFISAVITQINDPSIVITPPL